MSINKKKVISVLTITSVMVIVCLIFDNIFLIDLWWFKTKVDFKYYQKDQDTYASDSLLIACQPETLGNYILQIKTRKKYAIIAAAIRGDGKLIPFLEIISKNANKQDKELDIYCKIAKYIIKNKIYFPQKIENNQYFGTQYLGRKNFRFFVDIVHLVNELQNYFNIDPVLSIPLILQNYYETPNCILENAEKLFDKNEPKKSFILNYTLAIANNVQAIYNVGAMLYYGSGVKINVSFRRIHVGVL